MILQALVQLYEDLVAKNQIAPPGWSKQKVPYQLEIDDNGDLLQVSLLGDIEVVPHYTFEQLQKYLTMFGYDAEERNIINVADNEAVMVEVEVTDDGLRIIKEKRIRESME